MGACASKGKCGAESVREGNVEESVGACTSKTIVEERIERSTSHWSELSQPIEFLSVEEAAAIKLENEEVFKAWKLHPDWGFFFQRWDEFRELKVGGKFAEGAQAELFDVHVRWRNPKWNVEDMETGIKWVVKVFKEGTSLRDLQSQWPHGMFKIEALIRKRHLLGKDSSTKSKSEVMFATLLEDGRFAFLMAKEDEDLRSLIDRKMLEGIDGGSGPFPKVEAEEHMCDVAFGVDELHRFHIIHRDLKASNVLVYTTVRGNTYCVVSDYECSIGVVGTRWWRAPEILRACKEGNVKEKPGLFSKATDIYSLGMTFYEILTGKHPFQDEGVTMDLVIEGRRPLVPGFVDEWVRELLHQCWEPDCELRPSIEDVLGVLEANSSSDYIKYRMVKRQKVLKEDETLATN